MGGKQLSPATISVQEWFARHSGEFYSALQLREEFPDFHPKLMENILHSLYRNGTLARGTIRGTYMYPVPVVVRPDFKVARPMPKAVREPEFVFPVAVEYALDWLSEPIKMVLNSHYGKGVIPRLQAVDANTVIVWNSREQRETMRQIALGN